jgi:TolA-binding protein
MRTAIRTIAFVPTVFVLAALALSGCSAASNSSSQSGGITQPVQGKADNSFVAGAASSGASPVKTATVDRQVVQTGYVTVVVKDPLDASTKATQITESVGGRVDGRDEFAPSATTSGNAILTLRIPAASLDATLDKLKALGSVQEVSLSATDVTMQVQDMDARIKALTASINRLIELQASATDTDNLIKLETAISDRQAELESLQSQQRYLSDQVAMSTITLNLNTVETAVALPPGNFFSGLATGWSAFLAFFAGLLIVFGVLLPWLALAAVITFLVIFIVRRAKRRSDRVVGTAPNAAVAVEPVADDKPATAATLAAEPTPIKPQP